MEAATKNKRGRPAREIYAYSLHLRNINDEPLSDRAAQNRVHIENIECLLMDLERHDILAFFLDSNGNIRFKGILEQVGRMDDAGLFKTDDDIILLLEMCVAAYLKGATCKAIEKRLRQLRLSRGGRPNATNIE